jgi:hypothetical protein
MQYYHLDLWGTEWGRLADGEAARLAALAYQLPRDGRTWRVVDPAGANSAELQMLRRMELNQRRWHWAHTKGAESGSDEPQPVLLDGEREALDAAEEAQRRNAESVADAFGIDLTVMSTNGGDADG